MVRVLNGFLGQDTRDSLVPRPLTPRGCGINSSSKRLSRTFKFPMKAKLIFLFFFFLTDTVVAQDRPIRIGFPSVAFQELPLFAASKRGFFRAEGLNVELVQIAGSPAVAALLSGDVADLNRSVGITAMHSISTIRAGSASRLTPISALVGKSVLKYL